MGGSAYSLGNAIRKKEGRRSTVSEGERGGSETSEYSSFNQSAASGERVGRYIRTMFHWGTRGTAK